MPADQIRQAIQELKAGRLHSAEQLLAAMPEAETRDGRTAYYRGLIKWQLGDQAAALPLLEDAAAKRPRRAEVQNLLGQCRLALGDIAGAATALGAAFRQEPKSEEIGFALGNALLAKGDFKRAEEAYRATLRYHRRSLSVICNLAGALREQGRIEAAIVELKRALTLAPAFADAAFNLGVLYHMMGEVADARRAFERAVVADPNHALAHAGLAASHAELLDIEAADRHLARALALGPNVPDVRWTNFFALMRRGDLAAGWTEFEWRWQARRAQASRRSYPLPQWDGSALAGRRLLIWQEQGIGDEIMFASLLDDPKLREGQLVVLCSARLAGLFARALGHIRFVSDEQEVAELIGSGEVELQVAAGSLCRFLRRSFDAFPQRRGYLQASPDVVDRLAEVVRSRASGLCVGLSWRSGNPFEGRRRSIGLRRLAPLLAIEGCRFVSLQYGDVRDEVAEAGAAIEVLVDTDIAHDLENLAGLITNLDLVVSVDNTTAHMAGALGAPTWLLLPSNADWRWFGSGPATPWYPSLRLFRQTQPGDWAGVVAEAEAALRGIPKGKDGRSAGGLD